jgi:hypothetical protein
MSDMSTGSGLSNADTISILLAEYERLTAEIRMYIEEFSPRFNIFAVLVVSSFGFALQNEQKQWVYYIYAIIPLFLLLVGYVQIAQAYLITVTASRIRAIEKRFRDLNQGTPVMEWESIVVPKLIAVLMVRAKLKPSGKRLGTPNPLFISVIFIFVASLPIFLYCIGRMYQHLSCLLAAAYIIPVAASLILAFCQSLFFFRLTSRLDAVDYSD